MNQQGSDLGAIDVITMEQSTAIFLCNRPFSPWWRWHTTNQPIEICSIQISLSLCEEYGGSEQQIVVIWSPGPPIFNFRFGIVEMSEIHEMSSSKDYGNKSGISKRFCSVYAELRFVTTGGGVKLVPGVWFFPENNVFLLNLQSSKRFTLTQV